MRHPGDDKWHSPPTSLGCAPSGVFVIRQVNAFRARQPPANCRLGCFVGYHLSRQRPCWSEDQVDLDRRLLSPKFAFSSLMP